MRSRRLYSVVLTAALVMLAGGTQSWSPRAQTRGADEVALQQFRRGIDAYALMQREIERSLEPMVVTADAAVLQRAIEARAEAVRAARPEPQAGELFTPAVQWILRTRIAEALRTHRLPPADVLFDEMDEGNDDSNRGRQAVHAALDGCRRLR